MTRRMWAGRLGRLAVVAAALGVIPARGATIDFSDFSSLAGLTLNGSSSTIHGGSPIYDPGAVLRLTDDYFQSGSAFVTAPISLASDVSFSAAFAFRIKTLGPTEFGDDDGPGADGIVFAVQTVDDTAGGAGGDIGYGGLLKSVGIEFDTYYNDDRDPALPSGGNHVGINLVGSTTSVATSHIADRMNDGDIWYAWVDYDGTSDALEVRLNMTGLRPAVPLLSHVVDLPATLETTDAFVGFTSGTGSGRGEHDILSFHFEDSFKPIGDQTDPVPEPGTLALLSAGLVGVVRRRRRAA